MKFLHLVELVIALVGVVILEWWRRQRRRGYLPDPGRVGPEYFTRRSSEDEQP
jgi:hypothetical protein